MSIKDILEEYPNLKEEDIKAAICGKNSFRRGDNPSGGDLTLKFLVDECTGKKIADDKDFGELVFRLGKPSYGIILLRASTTNAEKRFQMIDNLLKSINVKKKFIERLCLPWYFLQG